MQAQRQTAAVLKRLARMAEQRPGLLAALALALVLALGAGAFGVAQAGESGVRIERAEDGRQGADAADDGAGAGSSAGASGKTETETVVVDVGGAVRSPSLVELAAGSRVGDAIEAAGGLTEDADTSTLNQAAILEDGQKILVPRKGEAAEAAGAGAAGAVAGGGATAGAAGAGGGAGATGGASALVNINSAGADELDSLPGVGSSTAQAIIDDRTQNGPFASTEDLMRVSGIGEKKFAKLESLICV